MTKDDIFRIINLRPVDKIGTSANLDKKKT